MSQEYDGVVPVQSRYARQLGVNTTYNLNPPSGRNDAVSPVHSFGGGGDAYEQQGGASPIAIDEPDVESVSESQSSNAHAPVFFPGDDACGAEDDNDNSICNIKNDDGLGGKKAEDPNRVTKVAHFLRVREDEKNMKRSKRCIRLASILLYDLDFVLDWYLIGASIYFLAELSSPTCDDTCQPVEDSCLKKEVKLSKYLLIALVTAAIIGKLSVTYWNFKLGKKHKKDVLKMLCWVPLFPTIYTMMHGVTTECFHIVKRIKIRNFVMEDIILGLVAVLLTLVPCTASNKMCTSCSGESECFDSVSDLCAINIVFTVLIKLAHVLQNVACCLPCRRITVHFEEMGSQVPLEV